ncbi:MAG TPA: T9SS type A sorting domain-containing protein, partial [Chitinophagales bacterium]|nr:T9SS type A sorting domain-containing protein [Chitinophagales bacterium]
NAGATYQWSDNSSAQTRTVSTPGTYPVTVTNGNCSATDAVEVSALVLDITTAAVNTTCGLNNGQASVVANNGTSPYTYSWNNTGNTDTIWNIGGGTYDVTVNDAAGCSATGSATVNTSGAGNVTITGTQTSICATDSANICAPTGYAAYLWNNGAVTECIRPSLAGNYYVTVTDNANCTSTSNSVAVSVYQVPSVSVSVSGDTLRAFNATSYQWYRNGAEIANANSDTYIATQPGSYTVQITDANGCVAVSNPLVVTGIEDIETAGIEVFPNPNATGSWQLVVGNILVGKSFEITDVTGKVVYTSTIQSPVSKVEPGISPGIYLLTIKAGTKSRVQKLIKL